jgi:uncharacterized protein (TIGR03067 family)
MSLRVLLAVALAVSLHAVPVVSLRAEEPKSAEATKVAEAPKSDKEKLAGWWRETSKTIAGDTTKTGENGWGLYAYRFHDDKVFEWAFNEDLTKPADGEYTLVVNERTNPKQLDLMRVVNGEKYVFPGIYEWDGEKLRYNGAMEAVGPIKEGTDVAGKRRPKDFKPSAPKARRHNRLVIFERIPGK